jgi:hypothetical protein
LSDKYTSKLAAKRWRIYINEQEDKKSMSNKSQNVIIIITVWILKLITCILEKILYKKERIVEKIPVE